MLHKELTDRILCAYYNVYNTLGYGFLEQVYQEAMCIELRSQGLFVAVQRPVFVYYHGQAIGEYHPDLTIDEKIILELKTAEAMHPSFEAQLLNYLRATRIEVGLVLNFGPKPEFRRKIYTNDRKHISSDDPS